MIELSKLKNLDWYIGIKISNDCIEHFLDDYGSLLVSKGINMFTEQKGFNMSIEYTDRITIRFFNK